VKRKTDIETFISERKAKNPKAWNKFDDAYAKQLEKEVKKFIEMSPTDAAFWAIALKERVEKQKKKKK
jgi:ribosome biogenesis GTPase A